MTALAGVPQGDSGRHAPASRCADRGEPRRPLFLGQALRGRMDLDGPSLRLRAAGRAERRFPLDRVSRVLAGARLAWSAEALRACLDRAIPIVIVDANGAPLGCLQPARLRPSRLTEALDELLEWPNWRDIYRAWLRAARGRVLAEWRRSRMTAGAPVDERAYRELLRQHVYGGAGAPARDGATQLWRGAIYALAAQVLERWRLAPVLWGSGGEALDLRGDLAQLMELRLQLDVAQGPAAAIEDEAAMVLVFETLAAELDAEAARAIRSLARRVNEVLSGGTR